MRSPAAMIGAHCGRTWLVLLLVLASASAYPQSSESSPQATAPAKGSVPAAKSHDQGKQPPAFSASGIHGSTAPSGYSTGLGREETSVVMKGVGDLDQDLFSGYLPPERVEDCAREPALMQAAATEPTAFGPNHALGLFYLSHGEFVRSIGFLDAAKRAQPADIDNVRALALALLGAARNTEAVALLEGATRNDRDDPALLRLLALAYRVSGKRDQSIQAYQRASSMPSGDPNNQFDCGVGLIGQGASDEAAKIFSAAVAAHPDVAKLWLGMGLVQDVKQDKEEALQSLLRAISTDPDYAPPYYFLAGLADASPERSVEIRKMLAEFVVSHPSSAKAHYDYALALWKQQRMHAAGISTAEIQSQLKLALTADPDMARAHFLLGVIYADANDSSSAERELLLAVKSEPEDAEAHYRLAQAYRRDHDRKKANAEMQRFLALHREQGKTEDSESTAIRDLASHPIHRLLPVMPCSGKASARP